MTYWKFNVIHGSALYNAVGSAETLVDNRNVLYILRNCYVEIVDYVKDLKPKAKSTYAEILDMLNVAIDSPTSIEDTVLDRHLKRFYKFCDKYRIYINQSDTAP